MKNERLKKKAERVAARLCIYLLSIVVKIFPEAILFRFSHFFGNASFLLASKRRKRAFENLTSAFKNEKSSQEIRKIAKQVFRGIALDGVATALFLLKQADIKKRLIEDISVEGTGYLDEALKNKKGVICVSAHFGNFMLMTLRLSLMGYPCNLIVKQADNPVVAEIWQNMMKGACIRWIPARPRIKAVSGSMRWLKSGGILFLLADQNKNDGVYVEFFNRPAGTVEGPAVLHLKTGATVLCAFIIRLGRSKHKIVITPPIPVKKTGNREEDVYQITEAFTKTIEDFVRRYPEQWWWPHKRWKKNR